MTEIANALNKLATSRGRPPITFSGPARPKHPTEPRPTLTQDESPRSRAPWGSSLSADEAPQG